MFLHSQSIHNILLLHFCANFQYALDFGLVLRWPFLSSGNRTSGRASGRANSLSEWWFMPCSHPWILQRTLLVSISLCLQPAPTSTNIHSVKYTLGKQWWPKWGDKSSLNCTLGASFCKIFIIWSVGAWQRSRRCNLNLHAPYLRIQTFDTLNLPYRMCSRLYHCGPQFTVQLWYPNRCQGGWHWSQVWVLWDGQWVSPTGQCSYSSWPDVDEVLQGIVRTCMETLALN